MPEPDEMQRFDALLEAMVRKPPLPVVTADDEMPSDEPDQREEG